MFINNKKTAVISGASRGIGRETAYKFAKEGYNLSLCAINNIEMLEKMKPELENYGVNVIIKKCDVSQSIDVKNWIKETYQSFGSIDVLVSNAGVSLYSLLINTKEDDFDKIISINLKGAFLLSKEVYDIMVSQKSGSIIFISSIWGKNGASFESVYSASKAGLIGLSKSLAKELAPSNIRVNTILAGVIETDMLSNLSVTELDEIRNQIPLKRMGKPHEIADVAYFLASEQASFISGTEISVDGLWS